MRIKQISLLLICSLFTIHYSFSQGYVIKGKIKGWHDTVCYLGNHYGDKKYVKDTTKIDHDGNFVFKGKEKLPGGIYLIVFPNKVYYEILIDKEQKFFVETDTADFVKYMKVKGSDDNTAFYKYLNYISDEQKKAEPLRKKVEQFKEDTTASRADTSKLKNKKGKTTQVEIPKKKKISKREKKEVEDSIKVLNEQIMAVDKDVETYKDDFMKNHPQSFLSAIFLAQKDIVIPPTPTLPNGRKDSTFPYRYYKEHYWDNLPLTDDRLLRTPIFNMKMKYYFDNVIMVIPDSIMKEGDILVDKTKGNKETFKYIVWYLTSNYETSPIMGMDAVFVHEVDKYYATGKAYWVDSVNTQKILHRALILKPILIDKPTPPLILQDTLGRNVSLYEVHSKYTLVIFWDPECGHCQKIVPKLKEDYDSKLKAKGVEVYAVDIEDDEAKWKKFIIDKKLNWINCNDKYKQYYLRDLYDIYSTPVMYLLDENKKIKAKRIDVDQIDGFIDHLNKVEEMEKKKR